MGKPIHLPGTFALPFKYHAEHRILKARYRVTNCSGIPKIAHPRFAWTVPGRDFGRDFEIAERRSSRRFRPGIPSTSVQAPSMQTGPPM
jgi:hypothetical protein